MMLTTMLTNDMEHLERFEERERERKRERERERESAKRKDWENESAK